MNRLLPVLSLLAVLAIANVSSAAAIYFRGNISSLSPGLPANGGADPLALAGAPASNPFEALVNTNNLGGITSGYIVFLGKNFNFTTGTVNTVAANPTLFSNMALLTPSNVATGQTLNISMPFLGSDNNFANLINNAGSFTISGGGLQYFGNITAIPEPGSMAVLAGLVMGCGGYSWRKRRKATATA